ncbi:MAG TPA: hypothetical protein DDW23_05575 [Planctomycetes bacterium]|nr:hypothetical protein [Planctomycetota bacterium]
MNAKYDQKATIKAITDLGFGAAVKSAS